VKLKSDAAATPVTRTVHGIAVLSFLTIVSTFICAGGVSYIEKAVPVSGMWYLYVLGTRPSRGLEGGRSADCALARS